MYSVLFVCTANICRSPMAMALLQASVGPDAADWYIESAGVWADVGYPAANYTQLIGQRRGIDLSSHRSRPVTSDLVGVFNLILTMERCQKEALQAAFPKHASRIYLFWEMVDKICDVIDPIGRSLADFEDTASEMDHILTQGFVKICQLAGEESAQDAS